MAHTHPDGRRQCVVREGRGGLGRRQGRLSPGNRCARPGSGHGAGMRGGAGQKETLGLRRGLSSGLWHQPRQSSRWVTLGRSFSLRISAHSPLKQRLKPSTTGTSEHLFPVCPSVELLIPHTVLKMMRGRFRVAWGLSPSQQMGEVGCWPQDQLRGLCS